MRTDLVLNAFGASVPEMVEAAIVADGGGIGGVWTFDHFSGVVVDAPFSRDPFVCLGAMACATDRVDLGVLVANIANRHSAQLASALSSLQSLAPGRIRCGIGAGAGPGSRFAAEQDMIGRTLAADEDRRAQLVEVVGEIRAMWNPTMTGPDQRGFEGVVDRSHPCPPIIVGANGPLTISQTAPLVEGVNIRAGAGLAKKVAIAREAAAGPIEISVFDRLDLAHPLGGDPGEFTRLGVDARTLMIDAPYDLVRLREIADNLT